MNAQFRPGRQIRRSKRLVLSVPVHVFGQDIFLESFNEFAHMLSVNAHGGALALSARVQKGQRILVVNKSTGQEQECRVVDVGSLQGGKWTVGIELLAPVGNFWKINFPACSGAQMRGYAQCVAQCHPGSDSSLRAVHGVSVQPARPSLLYPFSTFRILLPTTKAAALQSSQTTKYPCVI